MSLLNVNTLPKDMLFSKDSSLRMPCRKLKLDELKKDWFKNLVFNMFETLYSDSSGVGLAAPQVGVQIQVTVIDVNRDSKNPLVLINPKYIPIGDDKVDSTEGCLSIPNMAGTVKRFKKVKVIALNMNGEEIELIGEGFLSSVFQHEIDHLSGILYLDILDDKNDLYDSLGYNYYLAKKSIKNLAPKKSYRRLTR